LNRIVTLSQDYILRHLQVMLSSLGQLWRQPLANLMTTLVIGIALALPTVLFVLLSNLEQVSDQWDTATQISLFLQQDISHEKAISLEKRLHKWPEITTSKYHSAEQSLEEFRLMSGLGNLLDTLPDNPLPAVIVVQPNDNITQPAELTRLLTRLDKLAEVSQAKLDVEWIQRLRSINRMGQRGISILSLLLSLSVLLVIGNTIRLAILNRQSEIRVIKLVGGTNAFIRRPFLYSGFWYGFFGGLLAWITLLITLGMLNSPINELAMLYGSSFSLQWFAVQTMFMLPLSGALLGVLGAWLAVGRHLSAIEPN